MARAATIGLAIGFGSQEVIQDAVTRLTLIFSDLFDMLAIRQRYPVSMATKNVSSLRALKPLTSPSKNTGVCQRSEPRVAGLF
jgi:hypothetical protein